jgi:xanthine dehydrogenase YagS FAD-binding subunit
MNRFSYAAAATVDEALEALGAGCRPLAGGVDLLDRLKEGLLAPDCLVSLKQVRELAQVRVDADGTHLGAMVTLSALEAHPVLAGAAHACLRQALGVTASPQIRHMGTLGGNLLQRPRCWYLRNKLTHCLRKGGQRCFAFRGENERHAILGGGPCYIVHPSDLAVALLALDASVVIAGPSGTREVPLNEFYLAPRQDARKEAALAGDELLVEAAIPAPAEGSLGVYRKVAERGEHDFALASVAIQVSVAGGTVDRAQIALGGVAPVPWRAKDAEQALLGQPLTEAAIEQASLAATAGARPLSQNEYKVELAQGLVREALRTFVQET